MAEVRRRKVDETGGDGDATSNASLGTNSTAGNSEADKRNSSAAESSDHVSSHPFPSILAII